MRWGIYTGERTPGDTTAELTGIIEDSILNQPRSLQRMIGPSEIGNECDHCLAARLAGWEKRENDYYWASTVGTGCHLLMEQFFDQYVRENTPRGAGKRFVTEETVKVGELAGKPITGSTDLLDLETGMTIDWKFVGEASLRKYRNGPSPTYRVQAHLYAHGWNQSGVRVDWVSIYFLPRTRPKMSDGFWWFEKYDPQIALNALARLENLYQRMRTAFEQGGFPARDQWITNLPRAAGCWDCRKYPDHTPKTDDLHGITFDLPITA